MLTIFTLTKFMSGVAAPTPLAQQNVLREGVHRSLQTIHEIIEEAMSPTEAPTYIATSSPTTPFAKGIKELVQNIIMNADDDDSTPAPAPKRGSARSQGRAHSSSVSSSSISRQGSFNKGHLSMLIVAVVAVLGVVALVVSVRRSYAARRSRRETQNLLVGSGYAAYGALSAQDDDAGETTGLLAEAMDNELEVELTGESDEKELPPEYQYL